MRSKISQNELPTHISTSLAGRRAYWQVKLRARHISSNMSLSGPKTGGFGIFRGDIELLTEISWVSRWVLVNLVGEVT